MRREESSLRRFYRLIQRLGGRHITAAAHGHGSGFPLTGTEELTDENWNAYVEAMDGLGMGHCLEVWQTAWDNCNR